MLKIVFGNVVTEYLHLKDADVQGNKRAIVFLILAITLLCTIANSEYISVVFALVSVLVSNESQEIFDPEFNEGETKKKHRVNQLNSLLFSNILLSATAVAYVKNSDLWIVKIITKLLMKLGWFAWIASYILVGILILLTNQLFLKLRKIVFVSNR